MLKIPGSELGDEARACRASAPPAAENVGSLPPLRVHHLMLWMAVASVVFAVVFSAIRALPELGEAGGALMVLWFLPASAQAAALMVVLAARRSGVRVWQPGHGLLLLSSVSLTLYLGLWVEVAFGRWPMHTAYPVHQAVSSILLFAVGLALACGPTSLAWRLVFLWSAVEPLIAQVLRPYLFSVIGYDFHHAVIASYAAVFAPQVIGAGLVAMGVSSDHRRGTQRHWTHLLGVACVYLYLVLMVLSFGVVYSGPDPAAATN